MCVQEQILRDHLNEMESYINAADNLCLSLIDKRELILKAIEKMRQFSVQPCVVKNPAIAFIYAIHIGRKLENVMQRHNIYISLQEIASEAFKSDLKQFTFGNICQ